MEYFEITVWHAIAFIIILAATIFSYGYYCYKKEEWLKTPKPIKKMEGQPNSDVKKEHLSLVA